MLVESAGLNLPVAHARVFETELLQQPARPALIHDRHETLVQADARTLDLFPTFSMRSNGKIATDRIAPNDAVEFPSLVCLELGLGVRGGEAAGVFVDSR